MGIVESLMSKPSPQRNAPGSPLPRSPSFMRQFNNEQKEKSIPAAIPRAPSSPRGLRRAEYQTGPNSPKKPLSPPMSRGGSQNDNSSKRDIELGDVDDIPNEL